MATLAGGRVLLVFRLDGVVPLWKAHSADNGTVEIDTGMSHMLRLATD